MSGWGLKQCVYMCNLVKGNATNMVLVGWKNRDLVYCFTSECSTRETYTSFRIMHGGTIVIQCPIFFP